MKGRGGEDSKEVKRKVRESGNTKPHSSQLRHSSTNKKAPDVKVCVKAERRELRRGSGLRMKG